MKELLKGVKKYILLFWIWLELYKILGWERTLKGNNTKIIIEKDQMSETKAHSSSNLDYNLDDILLDDFECSFTEQDSLGLEDEQDNECESMVLSSDSFAEPSNTKEKSLVDSCIESTGKAALGLARGIWGSPNLQRIKRLAIENEFIEESTVEEVDSVLAESDEVLVDSAIKYVSKEYEEAEEALSQIVKDAVKVFDADEGLETKISPITSIEEPSEPFVSVTYEDGVGESYETEELFYKTYGIPLNSTGRESYFQEDLGMSVEYVDDTNGQEYSFSKEVCEEESLVTYESVVPVNETDTEATANASKNGEKDLKLHYDYNVIADSQSSLGQAKNIQKNAKEVTSAKIEEENIDKNIVVFEDGQSFDELDALDLETEVDLDVNADGSDEVVLEEAQIKISEEVIQKNESSESSSSYVLYSTVESAESSEEVDFAQVEPVETIDSSNGIEFYSSVLDEVKVNGLQIDDNERSNQSLTLGLDDLNRLSMMEFDENESLDSSSISIWNYIGVNSKDNSKEKNQLETLASHSTGTAFGCAIDIAFFEGAQNLVEQNLISTYYYKQRTSTVPEANIAAAYAAQGSVAKAERKSNTIDDDYYDYVAKADGRLNTVVSSDFNGTSDNNDGQSPDWMMADSGSETIERNVSQETSEMSSPDLSIENEYLPPVDVVV